MVLPTGFKPVTYALEVHYSILLSYGSIYQSIINRFAIVMAVVIAKAMLVLTFFKSCSIHIANKIIIDIIIVLLFLCSVNAGYKCSIKKWVNNKIHPALLNKDSEYSY